MPWITALTESIVTIPLSPWQLIISLTLDSPVEKRLPHWLTPVVTDYKYVPHYQTKNISTHQITMVTDPLAADQRTTVSLSFNPCNKWPAPVWCHPTHLETTNLKYLQFLSVYRNFSPPILRHSLLTCVLAMTIVQYKLHDIHNTMAIHSIQRIF